MQSRVAAALLVLLPCLGATEAPPHPDFTGAWTLDRKASDSIEPLLAATRYSWLERKLASVGRSRQEITQTPRAITIHSRSALLDRTETLSFDGSPVVATDLHGEPVTTRTTWSADGTALVTEADVPAARGGGRVRFTRRLEDGGRAMRQRMELERPDGTMTAERVFRRD